MKKNLFTISLFMAIITLVACENEIPFDGGNTEPKLIVYALLDAEKEVNQIFVGLTGTKNTTLVDNANIRIYINNTLADEQCIDRPTDPDSPIYSFETPYTTTKVRFSPSDVIRLEVEANNGLYRASAEVKVPLPIEIQKVDTISIPNNSVWNSMDKYLKIKTSFEETSPNIKYYRLVVTTVLDIEIKEPLNTESVFFQTYSNYMNINEDIVLTDGNPVVNDDDKGFITPVNNYYGVFDNSRINGSYTMTVSAIIPYSNAYFYSYDFNSKHKIERVKGSVNVQLKSISESMFLYLKALNTYQSLDEEDSWNLPVMFPSNIIGGTGVLGISIGSSHKIALEDYVPDEMEW